MSDRLYGPDTLRQPLCLRDPLLQGPDRSCVITEMQATLAALGHPRGISYRPVLIHVNGVMTDVVDSGFLASIVDAQALLRPARKQPSLF